MKRIQNFESHRSGKKVDNKVSNKLNEQVYETDDMYKVSTVIDVPKSFVNKYIKKVKDETNEDLNKTRGEFQIAEELVRYVSTKYLDNDILSSRALIGGEDEEEIDGGQEQAQTQFQNFDQDQAQGQNQAQDEERAQMQDQDQDQTQTQGQQQQAQDEEGFEDVQEDQDEEDDEDLPI